MCGVSRTRDEEQKAMTSSATQCRQKKMSKGATSAGCAHEKATLTRGGAPAKVRPWHMLCKDPADTRKSSCQTHSPARAAHKVDAEFELNTLNQQGRRPEQVEVEPQDPSPYGPPHAKKTKPKHGKPKDPGQSLGH